MNQNRIFMVVALILVGSILSWVAFGDIGENIVYFWEPTQVVEAGDKAVGATIRMGGVVKADSLNWDEEAQTIELVVSDGTHEIPIRATGAPPQMLREGIGVVVEGTMNTAGVFETDRLMVKHSNEYVAPEEGTDASELYKTVEGLLISFLGRALVLLALGACALGGVAGLAGGARQSAQAFRASRIMAWVFGGTITAATLLMEFALITHDFSVGYVAQVGSLSTPLHITIVSLWSSLEGSILFWAFVLGVGVMAFTGSLKDKDPVHGSYTLGIVLLISAFFTWLVAGVANPFLPVSPVPLDGPGPNALLQNHLLMIVHPPALYLGYVTVAVPFSMGAAALLAGRLEAAWMRSLRRWMLFSWSFLTLGLLLGGWWSYEVLGWGGYWAWDPVENAAFMPWLTASAFVHSAMVMERRGQFKGWTLSLALVTFLLTMLGTFMTRSGVFNSVHSFTQSPIGPIFLVFIAVASVFSLVLLALRLHTLRPPDDRIPGPISREVGFLINNLLFSAFTFTVLLGTLFPLIREALDGERLSVGEPYFNRMSIPICVALLFLMGIGPALPWGETSAARAFKRLVGPGVAMVGCVAVALLLGVREGWPLITFAAAGFAGWTTLRELFEPAVQRSRMKGEGLLTAFAAYAARSRARVAAYVIHFGVVMCAVAIAASSAYTQRADIALPVGVPVAVHGFELTYTGTEVREEPHRVVQAALINVSRGGRELGTLDPAMNHYRTMREPIGTPAVRSSWREDLYVSLVRLDDGGASVRVLVEPLVYWLWIGGLVMFGGGMYGFWPRRRRREDAESSMAAK